MVFVKDNKILTETEVVIYEAERFYKESLNDEKSRFHSWENCYSCFFTARGRKKVNYDYLCLQLGFYLANWGMFRNSFLLERTYNVHESVVSEILNDKYDSLLDDKCSRNDLTNADLLFELKDKLNTMYRVERQSVKGEVKSNISDVLLSKVLLGTLGCVPAYDDYFKEVLTTTNIAPTTFNRDSIAALKDFYNNNFNQFEDKRKKMKMKNGLVFPKMKFLDMAFWYLGQDLRQGLIDIQRLS